MFWLREHIHLFLSIYNLPQVSEMHFISYCVSHLHCAMCQLMLILYKFLFLAFYNTGYFLSEQMWIKENDLYIY